MRVAWTRSALSQLDEIQDYIAEDSSATAYRLTAALMTRAALQRRPPAPGCPPAGHRGTADTSPQSGRNGRVPGTRELVFADMPYIVVYRVREMVEVVAVIHSAREWPEAF